MTDLLQAKAILAQASRILASQGVLDAFGHISCRNPVQSEHFLISRNLAPALITPDDITELDMAANLLDRTKEIRLFLERFIHAEIYRVRPDVQAIVHSHALPVIPFTVVPGKKLRPICHMCGFLEGTSAPFDVADHVGPSSDLLIRSTDLGRALAEHLGDANVVLMRSHGFTAIGESVPEAVYRAIYTMRNCEIELSARVLGEPSFLSEGEAKACDATIRPQIIRAWDLWRKDQPSFIGTTN